MVRKLKKNRNINHVLTFGAVLVSAFLQCYVIQVFIQPANLLSSGFTGLAILINRIAELYGSSVSVSLAMLLLNLPVAVLCSRSISLKFTLYSITQVFCASFLLKVCSFEPIFDDLLLNVIFGGFFYGIAVVIALRGNASTGGTDFIALYVSNKTGKSIWEYVFAGNVVILVIFGLLFGWIYAGYSILFQFISTKTISSFHRRYERVTLQITTTQADRVIKAYVETFRHGISAVEATGGYSRQKMHLLHTVVSSYEVNDIVYLLKDQDKNIIINVMRTENFHGGFYWAPLE